MTKTIVDKRSTVLLSSLFLGYGSEAVELSVLVTDGQQSPNPSNSFESFEAPVIHDGGHVAFRADVRSNSFLGRWGIYKVNPETKAVDQIALEGEPAPDFNGNLGDTIDFAIRSVSINAQNQVAAPISLRNTLNFDDRYAIFVEDASSGEFLTNIRSGQSIPGGGESYRAVDDFGNYYINASGEVAVALPYNFLGDRIVVRVEEGDATKVIQEGDDLFPGSEDLSDFEVSGINDSGSILIHSRRSFLGGTILLATANRIRKLVDEDDSIPRRAGTLSNIYDPVLNNEDDVAFVADLSGTESGPGDNRAIFMYQSNRLREIATIGDLVPDGGGRFIDFDRKLAINDEGQVLFYATLTGASAGTDGGYYMWDGSSIEKIVRLGDRSPGGGVFSDFLPIINIAAFNDRGQIAFFALVSGGPVGWFFYDPDEGVIPIFVGGDSIPGLGDISDVRFNGSVGNKGGANSGLNNLGQVAMTVRSTSDRSAVVLWSHAPLNSEPVSETQVFRVNRGDSLTITTDELISMASDPDGDPIDILDFDATTKNGGKVTRQGDQFVVEPVLNSVNDTFTYTIEDSNGGETSVTQEIGCISIF